MRFFSLWGLFGVFYHGQIEIALCRLFTLRGKQATNQKMDTLFQSSMRLRRFQPLRNKPNQAMDERTFLAKIPELTETDLSELSLSTKLTELSIWDSMATAAFVAFAAEHSEGDLVSGIQKSQTVGDLFELMTAAVEPS